MRAKNASRRGNIAIIGALWASCASKRCALRVRKACTVWAGWPEQICLDGSAGCVLRRGWFLHLWVFIPWPRRVHLFALIWAVCVGSVDERAR